MRYTLWSQGRLLGESDLGYERIFCLHRMGHLFPTELGDSILPIAAGVSPAMMELARFTRAAREAGQLSADARAARQTVERTTEYADVAAAADRRDALHLELRGPNGVVIPTKSIDVRDTEFLMSLARLDTTGAGGDKTNGEDCDDDLLVDQAPEPWEARPPRYQLLVRLVDEGSVP